MLEYGFIGTGIIGEMLIKRFIDSGIARPNQIHASNKGSEKLERIVNETGIKSGTNQEVIQNSEIIYLCVKPQDLSQVYPDLKDNSEGKTLVTCVAAVDSDAYYQNLGEIELIRIIPSITNRKRGTILFTVGKNIKPEIKEKVYSDLSRIANVYEVEEEHINEYAHLASCSPAIISEFIKMYLDSIVDKGVNKEKGEVIILDALYQTATLLKEYGFKVIDEVCTPGGISRIGVDFVSERFPIDELSCELLGRMDYLKEKFGGKYES